MKHLAILLIMILPFNSSAMNYSVGDTLNVAAINGLTVRSIPSAKGEEITVLKTQERVYIKDTSNFKAHSDSIFGFQGNWIMIETTENITGYVFDAFLSTLPIAKSKTNSGEKIANNSFLYPETLTRLLKSYAIENFSKTDCAFEYNNRIDGESAHGMSIQQFQEGHILIEHQYWEGTSTELSLKNVRISEIYYLIHQFMKDTNEKLLKINDDELRNPKSYIDWSSCVAKLKERECIIRLYKDSENAYTIKFNFPCC